MKDDVLEGTAFDKLGSFNFHNLQSRRAATVMSAELDHSGSYCQETWSFGGCCRCLYPLGA